MRTRLTVLFALILAVPSHAQAPAAAPTATVHRTVLLMGTRLELTVEADAEAAAWAATEAAHSAARAVETRLSTWIGTSELAGLNATPVGEAFALSVELHADLARAAHWWRATGGAFDPAVGALVEIYDLRGRGRRPSGAELRAARARCGLDGLRLEPGRAVRERAGLRLEEGGFGKGVALDAALAAVLREVGPAARTIQLDLGGQILVRADRPGVFGIADPRDRGRVVCTISIERGSLATSGNSERGLEVDGQRLGHLLDPRTGTPAADFGSLTVWAPRAVDADCLSTALHVLGPDRALAFAAAHDDVEVVVLEAAPPPLRLRASAGLRGRLAALASLSITFEPPPARAPVAARPDQ